MKTNSTIIPLTLIAVSLLLSACSSSPNEFTISANDHLSETATINLESLPQEIPVTSEDENISRRIQVAQKDECQTSHPFDFETYSGEFTTSEGEKLHRLSYPEVGAGSLFVIDEYGYSLNNGKCLAFTYAANLAGTVVDGEYEESVYEKELDIAASIMSNLNTP